MTTHRPIEREPRSLRPPYDKPDPTAEQNLWSNPPETTESWRERNRDDQLQALTEVLGFTPTDYERQKIEWLVGWEPSTIAVIASLLDRNRQAGRREGEIQTLRVEAEVLRVNAEDDEQEPAARKAMRSEAARMRRAATRLDKTT